MQNILLLNDPYAELDPKALEEATEVDSQGPDDVQDVIAGTEAFEENFKKNAVKYGELAAAAKPTMHTVRVAVPCQNRQNLAIRTHDNKEFRIYFTNSSFFDERLINKLCRFLDTVSEDCTVHLILGVEIADELCQPQNLGATLSAITRCKATVIADVMGMCGLGETMMWAFAHERKLHRYGALTFNRPEIVSRYREFAPYFDYFFNRVKELGALNDEEIERITTRNASILKMTKDLS